MKTLCTASIAALLIAGGAAFAPSNAAPKTKHSHAECQSIWNSADAAGTGSLSPSDTDSFLANFTSADLDGNGSLSNSEFMTACNLGHVRHGASSGAGDGAAGSDAAPGGGAPEKY